MKGHFRLISVVCSNLMLSVTVFVSYKYHFFVRTFVSLEHKSSLKSLGIFVAIAKHTLYGSKLLIFLLCQKSLDIKIMFHEDILYRKYTKTYFLISNMHC